MVSERLVEIAKPEIRQVETNGTRETPSLFRKKKEEVKVDSVDTGQKNQEPIIESDLIEAWEVFGEKRKEKGVGEMEQLILTRTIKLVGETDATLMLNSPMELTIVDRLELELVSFLRKSLKNDFVQLKREVQEEEKSKKLYTSSDKYEYMLQQNPKLKELKDRLGLDFEF